MSEHLSVVVRELHVSNGDGWLLHLKGTHAPEVFDPTRRPIVIVPGYGMNSFIFGYHPRGTSMERVLAEAGFEVWSVNLRRQGGSKRSQGMASAPSMERCACVDVRAALEGVLAQTATGAERADVIGCSLGGTFAYGYLAAMQAQHLIGSLITVGAPLRWEEIHPALKFVFGSPRLAGAIPFSGTRKLARVALPLLAKVPGLLSIYMNTAHVDLSNAQALVRTVEDPHPNLNRDIALWMRSKDLLLGDLNVTRGLRSIDIPLLVVLANKDGIVPAPSVLSARDAWGGDDVQVLHVGDGRQWYAHADLFIGNDAPAHVFEPMIQWLMDRQ
jgi:pimeloyl-ACP methyl ester carboxylesterase